MKNSFGFSLICLSLCCCVHASEWPELPVANGRVAIPTQSWPQKPGPRTVEIVIHYPKGKLESVQPTTGLILNLHNWGGVDCDGAANPNVLASRLDAVAICVNYLQSGRQASVFDPEPYDCGYLQALDALRALWLVYHQLDQQQIPFAKDRIFATGGSGGGNVALMVNKLAPRTFTALVPMCGMAKLSDDLAFHLPGGSGLNARWSRDPASKNYLRPADQEIRFVGNPSHLAVMKKLGNSAHLFLVHGRDDKTCLFEDAKELAENFAKAQLAVTPHFVGKQDLDGKVFTSSGHPLGNRTEIPFVVAGEALRTLRRKHPADFDLRDEKVRYQATHGEFVISYKEGYPIARVEATDLPRVLEPPAKQLEPDRKVTYKTVGKRDLKLHVFEPPKFNSATDKRPLLLIIHGGGWTGGNARKYYTIAKHFAQQGMVGICIDYRLLSKQSDVTVFDCVRDGRSAVRYVRRNAKQMGIDPNRIAVAGGSAGGHVAAGTALLNFDEPGEAVDVSCQPNALILLNPVIDTSSEGYGRAKIGDRWKELSPVEHVASEMPPTIVFHSTADTVTPFAGAELFYKRMVDAGNDCQLVVHQGGRHGYFIFDLSNYRRVMERISAFLTEQKMLP